MSLSPWSALAYSAVCSGGRSKRSAFREIQNLLATKATAAIPEGAVNAILQNYGIGLTDAKPRLRALYAIAVGEAARDLEVTEQEEQELRRLRDLLGLTYQDVTVVENEVLPALYREEFRIRDQ